MVGPDPDNPNATVPSDVDPFDDQGRVHFLLHIYYDFNQAYIREDAVPELEKLLSTLELNPDLIIEIGSHTDSRGSDAYNLSLSDRRAKSSASYIVSQGIDKSRIQGKGYGEVQLMNRCTNGVKCSKEEHQLNRRTEFKITKY